MSKRIYTAKEYRALEKIIEELEKDLDRALEKNLDLSHALAARERDLATANQHLGMVRQDLYVATHTPQTKADTEDSFLRGRAQGEDAALKWVSHLVGKEIQERALARLGAGEPTDLGEEPK